MSRHHSIYAIDIPDEFQRPLKEKFASLERTYLTKLKISLITKDMAEFMFSLTEDKKQKYQKFRGDVRGVINSFDGKEGACVQLRHLPFFILRTFGHLKHKWFFCENAPDGHTLGYYLTTVNYSARDQYSPEKVTFTFAHTYRGKVNLVEHAVHAEFLRHKFPGKKFKRGITAEEVIQRLGYTPETDEQVSAYNITHAAYLQVQPQVGSLYWGKGRVSIQESYRAEWISLSREDARSRILVDDNFSEAKEPSSSSNRTPFPNLDYWSDIVEDMDEQGDEPEEAEEAEDDPVPEIPAHPYIHAFNLDKHQFIHIHTDSLTPYVFDTSLADKLILPSAIKELNSILIQDTDVSVGDIISGKSQGTLILASGGPGRGKTLTAEVYSESVGRPLYVVNCSQLGIGVTDIEKNLSEVLYRNRRWNAILLFDEADVYIHERGKDLVQNAIVGVFLRALERFEGVLFMTTNRATTVDDALLSRTTVHIRYPLPNAQDIPAIWRVQAEVQQIELSDTLITSLAEAFPVISGRDIRGLLRLSNRMAQAQGSKSLTLEIVQNAIKFKDLSRSDEPTT
jgi:hypothetical protein